MLIFKVRYKLPRIPKKLVMVKGLTSKKSTEKIQDPTGRSWLVKLPLERYESKGYRSSYDRYHMGRGWKECRKANQIYRMGTTSFFEFVKNSIVQLHISKNWHSVVLDAPNFKA